MHRTLAVIVISLAAWSISCSDSPVEAPEDERAPGQGLGENTISAGDAGAAVDCASAVCRVVVAPGQIPCQVDPPECAHRFDEVCPGPLYADARPFDMAVLCHTYRDRPLQ